jgi:hypothetical protein
MTEAISRDGFDELKNYLGVYLQQGRALLDSDWNENQDIAVSFLRRLTGESVGQGSPNTGFRIDPVFPPPPSLVLDQVDTSGMSFEDAMGAIIGACIADILLIGLYMMFGPILFFLNFPGDELERFESLTGFGLDSTQGTLRIGRDRPAAGSGFVRVSGHAGNVRLTKTLTNVVDLSASEVATFKFRLNHQIPGDIRLFLEDDNGDRSEWIHKNLALATDVWLSGFAAPLDLDFQILTKGLSPAVVNKSYDASVFTFGGKPPLTWTVSAGALPNGFTLTPGTGDDEDQGKLEGTPTAAGTSSFTVQATDADGKVATQALTLDVRASGDLPLALPSGLEMMAKLTRTEKPTGTPADLTQIRKYGFELYQNAAQPLVWDLDELRLGSSALEQAIGANNFIVRGSEINALLNQLTLMSVMAGGNGNGGGGGTPPDTGELQGILDLLNTEFDLTEPSIESAGRYYVDGLPCVQVKDVLYSEQADPNDPPLAGPPAGQKRTDTVYLDAWTEPVTYVEDPAIREVALGGPDTTTRRRVRHRVRVAQGVDMPRGNGIGNGTLATEGSYTAAANRLYRVEIDASGDIGTATFRWSEDNASTLQRVIAPVPPGSQQIVVEDASAFHANDKVLIRKEFGAERHEVATVVGNTITLVGTTGAQLGALPAAAVVPNFTTFSLADRPALQRWNAFGVAVAADPADPTVSGPITLNDGVRVRFGGHGMRRGDYWTFATRYLAGDDATGINSVTRIEQVDWRPARGVRHHYARLATLTRDGDSVEPDKIFLVQDRRPRVANAGTTSGALPDLTALTGTTSAHLGGMSLPPAGLDSKFVIFWSGDLYIDGSVPASATGPNLTITAAFYSDDITDPDTDPDTGKIQDRQARVSLRRRAVNQDIPLWLDFAKSDTDFMFLLPQTFVPTSVHLFAELDAANFTIQLTNMRLLALEIKKGY